MLRASKGKPQTCKYSLLFFIYLICVRSMNETAACCSVTLIVTFPYEKTLRRKNSWTR